MLLLSFWSTGLIQSCPTTSVSRKKGDIRLEILCRYYFYIISHKLLDNKSTKKVFDDNIQFQESVSNTNFVIAFPKWLCESMSSPETICAKLFRDFDNYSEESSQDQAH